ncbi:MULTISPECIES: FecR domain-containing protein [Sulfurimonas]|uniref:FecR family protein n=1 Tax=Sulfurimonas TaxID=202746 RepID=UPI0012652BA2|nr:FecR domain-containing protein [Sulfurimonas indica]
MRYIVMIVLFVSALYAKSIAIIKDVKGEVIAKSATEYYALHTGDELESQMVIITKNGSAVIVFNDNSTAVLAPYSILDLKKFVFKPIKNEYEFELFLKKGNLSFESGKIGELAPDKFILETPEGMVSIRGTKFYVRVQEERQ